MEVDLNFHPQTAIVDYSHEMCSSFPVCCSLETTIVSIKTILIHTDIGEDNLQDRNRQRKEECHNGVLQQLRNKSAVA